jgi:hypothetical protein
MAEDLSGELRRLGVQTEVFANDYDVAMVTVWMGAVALNVWCELGNRGYYFRWWTGATTDVGAMVFTYCPAHARETAVRRVHLRYEEMAKLAQADLLRLACGLLPAGSAGRYPG